MEGTERQPLVRAGLQLDFHQASPPHFPLRPVERKMGCIHTCLPSDCSLPDYPLSVLPSGSLPFPCLGAQDRPTFRHISLSIL